MSEITAFTKTGGPLTKRISLAADGTIISDGSACVMSRGTARRIKIVDVKQLAELIEHLNSDQAIALGALRAGLADKVKVVPKDELNGRARPDLIARTGADIKYREKQPAFALLDCDSKGMPPEVAAEIDRLGFWEAMLLVLPALRDVSRVTRRSTSAGLFRSDTGEKLPGSNNLHTYVAVQDGSDVEHFLKTSHDRAWLAGFGWMMVSSSGALLERSIVDRMVGGPERLVFEGAPILKAPLKQDRKSRRAVVTEGVTLDTVAACPPLTIAEKAKLDGLKARAAHELAPEAAKARTAFIKRQVANMVKRTGISERAAERVVARQCRGILLPGLVLPFDDQEFAGCTVGDVLADPERFEGATMADPLEGVEYGICKAKIMRRPDGTPWIHSFAHGRTIYALKLDAAAVRAAIEQAEKSAVVGLLVELTAIADLTEEELEALRGYAAERSGTTKRTIADMLKAKQKELAQERAIEERERRLAERRDPRPMINAPVADAPYLPEMDTLNDVIGAVTATKPPLRDIDDGVTRASKMPVPSTHAFTNSNPEEDSEEMTE